MDKMVLFLAAKSSSNFAEQLVLFLPPRFQCPDKDLLKMVAVVPGGMKENNVGSVFGSGYLHFAPLGKNAPEGQPFHWKQLGNPAFSGSCERFFPRCNWSSL
jgi:hypothetical protein